MKKKQNKLEDFERFLAGGGVVRGTLGFDSRNSKTLIPGIKRRPLRLFYGETHDEFGMPIDCLKYYFFVSLLHKYLEVNGIGTESTVVVADSHSLLNNLVGQKTDTIRGQTNKRLSLLERIKKIYHLPFQIRLISEIFNTIDYQEALKTVSKALEDKDIYEKVVPFLEKTVLVNRLTEERQKKFQYAREAIAASLLFDIKVGPPRERFYDEAAAIVASKLNKHCYRSIYLTPTYPLGLDFVYFLLHPEVEEFGLTPYKAGSNQLENNRIILGRTAIKQVRELVNTSFFPKQAGLPNPVEDVANIAKLAGFFLGKRPQAYAQDAQELYKKFIDEPLKEVNL